MPAMQPPQPTDLVYLRALVHERNQSPMAKSKPIWWRPDGAGYTHYLHQAGLYTREKALREQESTHNSHAATEVGTAYMLPMPELDFAAALTMVDGQDLTNITFMAYNVDVLGPQSGLYWGTGSNLCVVAFGGFNENRSQRIGIKPEWLVSRLWRVLPVDAIKWLAKASLPQPVKASR